MWKRNDSACILVLVALCAALIGWTDSWEQIKSASANISSVSARFTQKKHLPILSRPLVSQGKFFFQAPGSLRWEYLSPVRSIMLMHNGVVRHYIRSDQGYAEDAGERLQSMGIILQEMALWTKGRYDQNPHFTASLKNGSPARIILTPKEKSLAAMIARIEITLDPEKAGAFRAIKIVEGDKAFTLIEFADVRINQPLAETIFRDIE